MSSPVRPVGAEFTDQAELALALDVSRSSIARRAQREAWGFEEKPGRGGKRRLYPVSDIPAEISAKLVLLRHRESPAPAGGSGSPHQADGRSSLAAQASPPSSQGEAAAPSYDSEALWRWFNGLSAGMKEQAKDRLRAINAGLDLVARGVSSRQAWTEAGELVGRSRARVQAWHKALRDGGYHHSDWLPALAPRYQGRTATAECDPEVWGQIVNDYLRPAAPAAAACIYRARLAAADRGIEIPSDRTLLRWLGPPEKGGLIPAQVRILAREGVKALLRSFPAQRRSREGLRSMDLVNADGHKFDVMCRWPDGYVGRPIMLAWQDIYSGKLLEYEIGRTETSDLVRTSWGRLVTNVGIPAQVLFDNGRAFANKFMTGGTGTRFRFKILSTDPIGILEQMNVGVIWAEPEHGQSKPIERYFGDGAEYISRHILCEGAYVGNSPDAKPANYGERAMPIEAFKALVAQQVAILNAKPGRRGGVCQGRSFNETFDEGLQGQAIRRATAQQRHLWMLAAVGVKARKPTGEIHLGGNRYWDEALSAYMGESLIVRFNQDNFHEGVIVETKDGRQICHAACIDDTGFVDQAAAKESKKLLAAYRKKNRAALKALESAEALKTLRRAPTPPEPDQPIDHKVVAPVFGKRVAGSDVDPGDAAGIDEDYERFSRTVRRLKPE